MHPCLHVRRHMQCAEVKVALLTSGALVQVTGNEYFVCPSLPYSLLSQLYHIHPQPVLNTLFNNL